jgi:hypothetical protein
MGNIMRGHMILISIVILVFLVISGRKVDVRIRTPQQFDIQFDASSTESAQILITQFINTLDKRIALYPAALVSVIKEQFPFIQAVNTRLVPPNTMKLICKMAQPLCTINQNNLLVQTCICPNNYYCWNIRSSLPQINIDQSLLTTYKPNMLVTIVNKLNKNIFADYLVTVSLENTLIFEDKVQPRLSIICRTDNIPSETLCLYGKNMRELLENRKAFSDKANDQFVADLRFQKQIILTKK